MSLFGSMSTAISGLNAQAAAFSNISDNMANSQTVGYKGVTTNFIDYLTTSSAVQNQSGSVATRTGYQNEVQGTIQQSTDPLALAISGQGFFRMMDQSGSVLYSRNGQFQVDKNGFIVNNQGHKLTGYLPDSNGVIQTAQPSPLQITAADLVPKQTSNLAAGGLPVFGAGVLAIPARL